MSDAQPKKATRGGGLGGEAFFLYQQWANGLFNSRPSGQSGICFPDRGPITVWFGGKRQKGECVRKALAIICILALAIALTGAAVDLGHSTPPNLNIRIIGTASFQNRQTALIEDMNTHTDSFYKVGDPIYGFRIAEIKANGIRVEKGGLKYSVAFEPTALRARVESPTEKVATANAYLPRQGGAVVPNLYLPSSPSPNFYTDSPKSTQWDLWTASAGLPKPTGPATVDIGGRFAMPLRTYKRLSSRFGYRTHPIRGGTRMHKGIDLSARTGTKIYAADNGTVVWSGWRGGFGRCLIIDHHNGYTTTYGHCSKLVADTGDNVRRGDYIGDVGSTGASTGAHLHFEIRHKGTPVNPGNYFKSLL